MSQSDRTAYFCYFTVNDEIETIIDSVLLALSIIIIADAFRKYWRMKESHNSNVRFIYRMIFCWWITYVLTNVFGLLLLAIYNNSDDLTDHSMSEVTKYYFVLAWVNAFLIQWLLLYVPYHWAQRISNLFCFSSDKGSEVELVEKAQYSGYETKIYPVLKYYMKIRLIFLVLPIMFLILQALQSEQGIFKTMVASLLLDCLFIMFSLIFGMISLKRTAQLKQQLDETQSKRMFNQYLMIIIANAIRFGFDMTYVINKIVLDDSFPSKCPDLPISNQASEIVFNICECVLTHYLPIFIILRIYSLDQNPEQISKSIIYSGSDSGFGLND